MRPRRTAPVGASVGLRRELRRRDRPAGMRGRPPPRLPGPRRAGHAEGEIDPDLAAHRGRRALPHAGHHPRVRGPLAARARRGRDAAPPPPRPLPGPGPPGRRRLDRARPVRLVRPDDRRARQPARRAGVQPDRIRGAHRAGDGRRAVVLLVRLRVLQGGPALPGPGPGRRHRPLPGPCEGPVRERPRAALPGRSARP